MEKHFELTDETIEVAGKTLHRIRCTRDCKWAKTGDLGGFIEKEDNLFGQERIGCLTLQKHKTLRWLTT